MKQGITRAGTAWAKAGRRTAFVVAAGAVSVAALGAGAAPGGATPSRGAKVTVVTTPKGKVLAYGNTLYTLQPSATACTATCLATWPAAVLPHGVKQPKAGQGVSAAKLHTVKVPGLGNQLTYAGKKLYWYVGDTMKGQVNGNLTDTWGTWTAVALSKPSGSSSSTGSGSGSGSGSNAGSGGVSF